MRLRFLANVNKTLGKVIAELRNDAGKSQESLAFDCGLHPTYISQIERGKKSPTVRVLFLLAEALGVKGSSVLRKAERRAGE